MFDKPEIKASVDMLVSELQAKLPFYFNEEKFSLLLNNIEQYLVNPRNVNLYPCSFKMLDFLI
jgi:hypothetical protein